MYVSVPKSELTGYPGPNAYIIPSVFDKFKRLQKVKLSLQKHIDLLKKDRKELIKRKRSSNS